MSNKITYRSLQRVFNNGSGVSTVIAAVNNKYDLVGAATVSALDKNSSVAWFFDLFVADAYRGNHIATNIVQIAINIALEYGKRAIALKVENSAGPALDKEGLISFYRKLGFSIATDYDDGSIMMSLELESDIT